MITTTLPEPEDVEQFDEPFQPLRRASGLTLVAAVVLGPILWVAALLVTGWLVKRTDAIELGLLVTAASFVIATVVLGLLRLERRREERRYANRV